MPACMHGTSTKQRRALRDMGLRMRRLWQNIYYMNLPEQILLEGTVACPHSGASCLSAEYTWRQLVPDVAALARSLCLALEAWPKGVPQPRLPFTDNDPAEAYLHGPLGLQYTVRAPLLVAVAHVRLCPSPCFF